jgi:hypothetical protein
MSETMTVNMESRMRKRARTSNASSDGDDDGKKRGRPRVEKQDESAADRRRTQIRMAQRAYRQRKESTLEVSQRLPLTDCSGKRPWYKDNELQHCLPDRLLGRLPLRC